jgi:hypothetical protein
MKRVLAGILLLSLFGCGGGSGSGGSVAATSYAGNWGYDDPNTKIRVALTDGSGVFGYDGSIHVETNDGTGISDAFGKYSTVAVYSGRNGGQETVNLRFHTGSYDATINSGQRNGGGVSNQYGLLNGASVTLTKPDSATDPQYAKLLCDVSVYGVTGTGPYTLTRR